MSYTLYIYYTQLKFISQAELSQEKVYKTNPNSWKLSIIGNCNHLMCSSRKYPYSPHGRFLFCTPLPPGNSSLFSYISSKNLAFKTLLPLGISNDLPWGGYGFFLEPHNIASLQCSKYLFIYLLIYLFISFAKRPGKLRQQAPLIHENTTK